MQRRRFHRDNHSRKIQLPKDPTRNWYSRWTSMMTQKMICNMQKHCWTRKTCPIQLKMRSWNLKVVRAHEPKLKLTRHIRINPRQQCKNAKIYPSHPLYNRCSIEHTPNMGNRGIIPVQNRIILLPSHRSQSLSLHQYLSDQDPSLFQTVIQGRWTNQPVFTPHQKHLS